MVNLFDTLSLTSSRSQFLLTNKQTVLADIRFNERRFLLADSGSGKTTLLKRLVGIIRDPLDQRFLDSFEIQEEQLPRLRRQMALLQQQTFGNSESLKKQISFASECLGENFNSALTRALTILEVMGRPELIETSTDNLSGGEKQIVLLTKAFTFRPQFLLLDEPTTALDDELKSRVERFIVSSPIGFIWITHDKHQIERLGSLHTSTIQSVNGRK